MPEVLPSSGPCHVADSGPAAAHDQSFQPATLASSFIVSHFSASVMRPGEGEGGAVPRYASDSEDHLPHLVHSVGGHSGGGGTHPPAAGAHSSSSCQPSQHPTVADRPRLEESLSEDPGSHGWVRISVGSTSIPPEGWDSVKKGGGSLASGEVVGGEGNKPVIMPRQAHFIVQDAMKAAGTGSRAAGKPDKAMMAARAEEFDRAWDAVIDRLIVEGQIMGASRPLL